MRDETNGMPWWVKAVTLFGVPSTIALFLVYVLVNVIAGEVRKTSDDVGDTNALIKAHIEASDRIERMHQENEQSMHRILRAICVNGAANQQERAGCIQ